MDGDQASPPMPPGTPTWTTRRSPCGIIAEAGRIDAAEDELYGDRRGDEPPEAAAYAPRPPGVYPRCQRRRHKEEREAERSRSRTARAERLEICRSRRVAEHRTVVAADHDDDEAEARRSPPGPPAEVGRAARGARGEGQRHRPDSRPTRSPESAPRRATNAEALAERRPGRDRRRGARPRETTRGRWAPMVEAGGRAQLRKAGKIGLSALGSSSPTSATGRPTRSTGSGKARRCRRSRPTATPGAHPADEPCEARVHRRRAHTHRVALNRRRQWMIEAVFATSSQRACLRRFDAGASARAAMAPLTAGHHLLEAPPPSTSPSAAAMAGGGPHRVAPSGRQGFNATASMAGSNRASRFHLT